MATHTPQSVLLDSLDRVAESVPSVLEGLSTEQATYRPDPGANSITWLVWHLTRQLDAQLAEAFGVTQVYTEEGYDDRLGLGLDPSDHGYGHDAEQVGAVVVEPLSVLADYHAAVNDFAHRLLEEEDIELDQVIDERWDPPVTLVVRLVSVVDDAARHIGQAEFLRGLVLRR